MTSAPKQDKPLTLALLIVARAGIAEAGNLQEARRKQAGAFPFLTKEAG